MNICEECGGDGCTACGWTGEVEVESIPLVSTETTTEDGVYTKTVTTEDGAPLWWIRNEGGGDVSVLRCDGTIELEGATGHCIYDAGHDGPCAYAPSPAELGVTDPFCECGHAWRGHEIDDMDNWDKVIPGPCLREDCACGGWTSPAVLACRRCAHSVASHSVEDGRCLIIGCTCGTYDTPTVEASDTITMSDLSFAPISGAAASGITYTYRPLTGGTGYITGTYTGTSTTWADPDVAITPVRTPHPPEVDNVAGWAKTWAAAETKADRREPLQRFALAVVRLREKFTINYDGEHEDWDVRGRSFAYRDSYTEAMFRSGISKDDQLKLGGSARYYIGEEVRRCAPTEVLERAGLDPRTPKQRGRRPARRDTARIVELTKALAVLVEAVDALPVAPELYVEHPALVVAMSEAREALG